MEGTRMQLTGYRRSDGRVGFRNHVLVLPMTGCQMRTAQRIADCVPGATCFAHPNGCDLHGPDFELFGTILEQFCTHPNVGGVVFLAMGCAQCLQLNLPRKVKESGRLSAVIGTHIGSSQVVDESVREASAMVEALGRMDREPVSMGDLVLGTKCGASDPNSFSVCHPVVGGACDMLMDEGATVVLGENCELVGAAEDLAQRATDPNIAERIRGLLPRLDREWNERFGYSLSDLYLEKMTREEWRQSSLGHAAKAGTKPITGFFDMGEAVRGPGLVVLDGDNTDLESTTALAAAGCQFLLFTTGRGTPIGSPAAITLKITATAKTAEAMAENIDVSVADVTDGTTTQEDAARRVMEAIVAAANGEQTKAEQLGHWECAIPIRGVTY